MADNSGMVGGAPALKWAVNIAVVFLVVAWTLPTFGILISSVRDKNQLALTGWWTSLTSSERNLRPQRAPAPETAVQEGDVWVITGKLLDGDAATASRFGISSQDVKAYEVGRDGRS